ncbi:Cof-type HAD-IIB family hydrolase [Acetivibrio cellulolyticus]|uniref:Cof-type HAD-IIB family hydrolase n=1 Tax=Acetivibrio cellulolyticus TaxID=35830 RepID=UPI0001E3058C|nr:Cof-type HAD-IIB family hydrolase [Acetivibrio cellulolyticus]
MYKMIAIDLDGTLLNSNKEISKENEKCIKLAIEKGIKVVICSGRIYPGAKIYAEQVSLVEPLIVCNGAVIRDLKTDEVYYANLLSKEDCNRVIDILHSEGIYFHTYIDDVMYAEKLDYSALYYMIKSKDLRRDFRIDVKVVESVKDIIAQSCASPAKIVVMSSESEALMRARQLVDNIKTVEVVSSNYDNFEVLNYGVGKGKALEIISQKLSVKREEIIAIGDNENDYSMLKYAGLSIAMGNAEDSIKKICDFVTLSNNENGVAYGIKKFVL